MPRLFERVTAVPLTQPDRSVELSLADEVMVRLTFNGILPHGVMMLTPDHLGDFVYGYCLTEGFISRPDQIRSFDVTQTEDGLAVGVEVAGEALSRLLKRRARVQTGHTSCGVCGSDDIPISAIASLPVGPMITPDAVRRALDDLGQWQRLNAETRMVHGAAWAATDGRIVAIREDVGRHNALDKLIGARIRSQVSVDEGFCVLTSRCSFEMVSKAVSAGISIVVAISAPTIRALRLAEDAGMTLIAVARHDRQLLFTGRQRVFRDQIQSG